MKDQTNPESNDDNDFSFNSSLWSEGRKAKIDAALELLRAGPTTDERILGLVRLGQLREHHDQVLSSAYSKSNLIRQAATSALGNFCRESDLDILLERIFDKNTGVRKAACSALGTGKFDAACDHLWDVAQDESEEIVVRVAAVTALVRIVPGSQETIAFATDFRENQKMSKSDYVYLLGLATFDEARLILEELLLEALSTATNEAYARTILQALTKHELSERGKALVVRVLTELPGGRTVAITLVKKYKIIEAKAGLENLLKDPSEKLVAAAASTLLSFGLPDAEKLVLPIVKNDSSLSRYILQKLDSTECIDLLINITQNGHAGLRPIALQSLCRIDPSAALDKARQLVTDINPKVRLVAYKVLIDLDKEPAHWQFQMASDPVEYIRNLAN
jgi:HEAT repeat protein